MATVDMKGLTLICSSTSQIKPSISLLSRVVRRKSHLRWKWSTDFFWRLISVYIRYRWFAGV